MKYTLRIMPAADTDVDQAAAYIAEDSLDSALRFYDAVGVTFRELREHPERWPLFELSNPRLEGLRKRAVIGFHRYIVFYRIEGRIVRVVRVLHGARDLQCILSDNP
ncbi:MAG TPA: type II toxin-antitoxin system RelE/ParE family toxin [Tepidisphaeraceae bacterium]|nr:type II toxin-antitoxin system RelE/ParE family toxin [Tepidisphaeraceae bacterium]